MNVQAFLALTVEHAMSQLEVSCVLAYQDTMANIAKSVYHFVV